MSPYAPDGDSVRFVPEHPAQLEALDRGHALRVAPDGSVQLRFQGIDAPELHYAGHAQPLGVRARDALLHWLGFASIAYANATSSEARACHPHSIEATIFATAVDRHGRPIAYLLRETDALHAKAMHGHRQADVDAHVLARTANAEMLRTGLAYPLFYTSMVDDERACFDAIARDARRHRRGVWAHDETRSGFRLHDVGSLGVGGALVFPKIFRRAVDYFADRTLGFVGTFKQWIDQHVEENDRIVLPRNQPALLGELLMRRGDRLWLDADVFDLTFLEH